MEAYGNIWKHTKAYESIRKHPKYKSAQKTYFDILRERLLPVK